VPLEYTAEKYHNIKTGYKSFENVEHFKYFGATITNENPFTKKLRAD
jgi:hypothetical protein